MSEDELLPYSRLRMTNRQNLAEILPLDYPFTLFVDPSSACNFRCRQCPQFFDDFRALHGHWGMMSLGLYQKIVRDLHAWATSIDAASPPKIKSLNLYGYGEPLLNKKIGTMLKMARDAGVAERITITTNGSHLPADVARELVQNGLTYLRVSIYSVVPERHQRLTNSRIGTEEILQNVLRLKNIRDEMGSRLPFIHVKMLDSLTEENHAFRDMYKNVADETLVEGAMNWNDPARQDLIGNYYGEAAIDRPRLFPHVKQVCPQPFYCMMIAADGDVSTCCVDWNKKTKVGNAKDTHLRDIWCGAALKDFRRMHLARRKCENEACDRCTYLYTLPDNLDSIPPDRIEQVI